MATSLSLGQVSTKAERVADVLYQTIESLEDDVMSLRYDSIGLFYTSSFRSGGFLSLSNTLCFPVLV